MNETEGIPVSALRIFSIHWNSGENGEKVEGGNLRMVPQPAQPQNKFSILVLSIT